MTLVMHGSIWKSYAFMHDSLQCMTLGTTLYSIWHAVNGKQSVAAAHSLTLPGVAVDPDEPLPCYVVPCIFWSVLFSIGT